MSYKRCSSNVANSETDRLSAGGGARIVGLAVLQVGHAQSITSFVVYAGFAVAETLAGRTTKG